MRIPENEIISAGAGHYLKAPFPYFGGKSLVADKVWQALGEVDHYMEPFFGSGAVLLKRPDWNIEKAETVNDKDGHLCNAWRGIQFNPDEVAKWCDWPCNHADLMARRKYLAEREQYLLDGLVSDPKWHDAELAGYWIWCASLWIGGGMMSVKQIPNIAGNGKGVNAKSLVKSKIQIPFLGCDGMGIQAKRLVNQNNIPAISHDGMGINSKWLCKRPQLSHNGNGVCSSAKFDKIYEWFNVLSYRLRRVRVVCGEWNRICGGDWQDDKWKRVGIFFDPPYGVKDRSEVYKHDSTDVAKGVMKWCLERGDRKNYRIVLAGYEEYQELLDHGWKSENWTANGGMANTAKTENRKEFENRSRECLYFSPHCNMMLQEKLF